MYCSKCGTNVKAGFMYCPQCGIILSKKEAPVTAKGIAGAAYDQAVHDAAHRLYREWQRSRKRFEDAKIRSISREVYEEMQVKAKEWYELKEKLVERNRKKNDADAFINRPKASTNSIPNRAGLPWASAEDNVLRDELYHFMEAAAKSHGRTYNAISARLKQFYKDAAR